MGKDGVSLLVLENLSDLIIKKGGEGRFRERVPRNEIYTYPTPPFGYSWLSIGFEDRSRNRFEISANLVLKFRFEH